MSILVNKLFFKYFILGRFVIFYEIVVFEMNGICLIINE